MPVKDKTKISPKQKLIAAMYAKGKSQSEIAKEFGLSQATICEHLSKPIVKAEVQAIQARVQTRKCLTLADRREKLSEIVNSSSARHGDIIKAMELDAKLAGDLKSGSDINLNIGVAVGDTQVQRLSALIVAGRDEVKVLESKALLSGNITDGEFRLLESGGPIDSTQELP